MPNASVMAWREAYDEGHKTIRPVSQATSDDLGAFRLFGLPPGRYFVSAIEQRGGQLAGDREFSARAGDSVAEQGYAKTYYPGTADISRATTIAVKEGEEIPGMDISLKQVMVHRIRGLERSNSQAGAGYDGVVNAAHETPGMGFFRLWTGEEIRRLFLR